jgi:anti-sigma-K factor RskA
MKDAQPRNVDQILAGEYALGLLVDDEKTAFEARLGAEPALRRYYTDWIEDFVSLTDDIGEVAPPVGFYAGLENRLFAKKPVAIKPARSGSLFRFMFGGMVALIACVATLLMI